MSIQRLNIKDNEVNRASPSTINLKKNHGNRKTNKKDNEIHQAIPSIINLKTIMALER